MKKCAIVFVVTLVAVTVSVSAAPITVENHSFELPGTGKPGIALIPGWEGADDNLWAGAEIDWGPTDGTYTGYMQTGAGIYNLTDHTIAGGMEYTLTFDMRKTWWGDTTTVDLYYDDNGNRVPIGSVEVTFADQATTDMEEQTITVRSDDVPASIGKKLGIQITCGTLNSYEDGWVGYDNFRLDGISWIVIPIHPVPPGVTFVGIDDDLGWAVVNDWNVDLYFSPAIDGAEPNFFNIAPVLTDTSDTTYDPGTMDPDTTYYWRADAYEPNTVGTAIGFIVHTGPVWSFTTAPATPTITLQPISQTVAAGSEVVLAIDGTNIDEVQWFRNGTPIAEEDDDVFDLTLTLSDVQVGEEGYYHCVASNTAGEDPSETARLLTRRLAGWWKLDGNLNDSVADKVPDAPPHAGTGTIGEPNYVVLGADGSAVDFLGDGNIVIVDDSAEYFNFYPHGYTVSAWVKNVNSGWGGVVGKQNEARTPDHGWVLNHNGDTGSSTLRQTPSGDYGANAGLMDGEWHLITGTFDAEVGQVKFYANGELAAQSGEGIANITGSVTDVVIGAESTDGASPLTGLVDDVRIWTYALDDIAIALLYTDFNPGSEVCIGNPSFDSTGPDGTPDCRINVYELAVWAAAWLECNTVPTCIL